MRRRRLTCPARPAPAASRPPLPSPDAESARRRARPGPFHVHRRRAWPATTGQPNKKPANAGLLDCRGDAAGSDVAHIGIDAFLARIADDRGGALGAALAGGQVGAGDLGLFLDRAEVVPRVVKLDAAHAWAA